VPPTIHILKPEVANKIAAGEVVQRPAAAVKELIENALDANAKKVSIIVKGAGKTLLQVIDDGAGMTPEDAMLAFQRHATSKISSAEDLESIRTLGFRGEALASIAAVAQVELRTRTRNDDVGTLLRVEGNEEKERSKVSIEPGTNITVKNLFYNTPARRNFLKTDHTELKNITEVVTRMAVVYPEVAWLYVSDDETLLDLKPGSREDRFIDVFGERHFKSVVTLAESTEYLSVEGFIGKPEYGRKSRSDQYLYINRRFIVSRAISHAVFHAYEHLMVKGAFPFFVLNISLDPHKVDVNVHPSKMEVKFENESNIYRFVLSVIRKTLAANDLIPSVAFKNDEGIAELEQRLGFSRPTAVEQEAMPAGTEARSGRSWWRSPATTPARHEVGADAADVEKLFSRIEHRIEGEAIPASSQEAVDFAPKAKVVQHEASHPLSDREPVKELRAIWQLHNKYILSQIRTGLLIVDQHVAHERVLYERVLANFEKDLPSSQQLLFPQTVPLGAHDYTMVKELLPHLEKLGFNIKLFGKNTVVIEGIPADVRLGNESGILQEVLDEFKNNEHNEKMDARDNLAKSFSCKAAIKAGDKLNTTEMISLIDQLFATSMPYVCPHGRPVVVKVSIDELDKRFGRT